MSDKNDGWGCEARKKLGKARGVLDEILDLAQQAIKDTAQPEVCPDDDLDPEEIRYRERLKSLGSTACVHCAYRGYRVEFGSGKTTCSYCKGSGWMDKYNFTPCTVKAFLAQHLTGNTHEERKAARILLRMLQDEIERWERETQRKPPPKAEFVDLDPVEAMKNVLLNMGGYSDYESAYIAGILGSWAARRLGMHEWAPPEPLKDGDGKPIRCGVCGISRKSGPRPKGPGPHSVWLVLAVGAHDTDVEAAFLSQDAAMHYVETHSDEMPDGAMFRSLSEVTLGDGDQSYQCVIDTGWSGICSYGVKCCIAKHPALPMTVNVALMTKSAEIRLLQEKVVGLQREIDKLNNKKGSSMIIRFESMEKRDTFKAQLRERMPKLAAIAISGQFFADLLLKNITDQELQELRTMDPTAKFHEDFKHDLFSKKD